MGRIFNCIFPFVPEAEPDLQARPAAVEDGEINH